MSVLDARKNRFLLALSFSIICLISLTGCRSGFFSGTANNPPAETPPPAPIAPVVVDGMRTSYADIVDKTSPAVVRIQSEIKGGAGGEDEQPQSQSPFDDFFRNMPMPRQEQPPQRQVGIGSGVIVSADGTILTNNHVVEGAEKITVEMNDNKKYTAKVIGLDKASDLAVLKIEGQNLPFLNLGNSDNVRVGDIVLAIGNPLGIGQSVTAGIISAKGRRTGLSDGSFEDFLQTDAPINRGNSGGALVNLTGELVGINSQILAGGASGGNIGIGFSIPSNMAKSVMEQLIQNGKVRRGMLGVNIQNVTEDLAQGLGLKSSEGVLISNVSPNSAADKAGLKRGDVIIGFNGEKVEDTNVLRNKVAGTAPGTEINLTINRDGNEQTFKVVLDELPNEKTGKQNGDQSPNQPNAQPQQGKLGVTLQPLTADLAQRLKISPDTKGLVVTEVNPGGAAGAAGIQRGDVIMEINRKPVASIEDAESALAATGDKTIVLVINRGGTTSFIPVSPN